MISALPLYVSAFGQSEFLGPTVRRLPIKDAVMGLSANRARFACLSA
jgi:hypothetical protein